MVGRRFFRSQDDGGTSSISSNDWDTEAIAENGPPYSQMTNPKHYSNVRKVLPLTLFTKQNSASCLRTNARNLVPPAFEIRPDGVPGFFKSSFINSYTALQSKDTTVMPIPGFIDPRKPFVLWLTSVNYTRPAEMNSTSYKSYME